MFLAKIKPMELSATAILPTFLLIFARVAGLVFFAPGWGETFISIKIRGFLSVILTFALFYVSLPTTLTTPQDVWLAIHEGWSSVASLSFAGILLIECVIGILQATLLRLIFTTLEYVGTLVAQMGSMSMAEVFDPQQSLSTNIFAHLLGLCGLAVYFAIGGDRLMIKALMDDLYHSSSPFGIPTLLASTSTTTPIWTATNSVESIHTLNENAIGLTHDWISPLLQIVTQSMISGVLIALPILISLGTVYFLMSLLSRLVSAWSFWNTGLPVVVLSVLGLFAISFLWILTQFENFLGQLL